MRISVIPKGNIGNRIIQYLFALALADEIGSSASANCGLPEFGIPFQPVEPPHGADGARTLAIADRTVTSLDRARRIISNSEVDEVICDGYFQRVDLLREKSFYASAFPAPEDDGVTFDDDEIAINIRGGEILGGVGLYPLAPPEFHRDLIKETGYRPVFIGQLGQSAYTSKLREFFPNARMIPSAGPLSDFNRLRRARRICLAVSTFSWAAAFLSDAAEIHLPLLGFLHPQAMPPSAGLQTTIDLAPSHDHRYVFHLLPKLHGASEEGYLRYTETIPNISRRVSRNFVTFLRSDRPIIHGFPKQTDIDEWWYIREYLDAAWDLSSGVYRSASDHWVDIGSARGYRPRMPLYAPKHGNASRGKTALQSSVSMESRGRDVTDDAARVLQGNVEHPYANHTELQDNPWWMVDLGLSHDIECVNLYNRRGDQFIRRRLFPFTILSSEDGSTFSPVVTVNSDFALECPEGRNLPFQYVPDAPLRARFLKIVVERKSTILHLAAVDIFGAPD